MVEVALRETRVLAVEMRDTCSRMRLSEIEERIKDTLSGVLPIIRQDCLFRDLCARLEDLVRMRGLEDPRDPFASEV